MRQGRRLGLGAEFTGTILPVRAVEDSIRASKKYTEGIRTMHRKHPIQGQDFPSSKFMKYYEVYPKMKVGWDMPILDAVFLLAGDRGTHCIDVLFSYDYRFNKASVIIQDGAGAVKILEEGIPNFADTLAKVTENGK